MKVPKGERPFWSLFGDIGTTNFSYDFIYDNFSSPCVQASIEQWIGDLTWKLEVKGSNPGSDKPFSSFYLILFWANIYEEVLFLVFFSTHYASYPSYDTSSWSNNSFEFIKFRSAFASLCDLTKESRQAWAAAPNSRLRAESLLHLHGAQAVS